MSEVTEKERPAATAAKQRPSGTVGVIFALLSVLALVWVLLNLHPDSGVSLSVSSTGRVNLVESLSAYSNNISSDALQDLVNIKRIYIIPENATIAPKPIEENFGSTTDPQEVMKIIEQAEYLLDGQDVVFDPEADFLPDSTINYYLDDTIMVITWKELRNWKRYTMAEIKIAHGSQIRRKLTEDMYGSSQREYGSDMAKECNAVFATNGDFYGFRGIGVTSYQRKLYRFSPNRLDSCHFTSSGDMIFSYAGELTDEESTQKFIDDNDVVFTIAFGPVLVDNGERKTCYSYPIGEVTDPYSRSALGQVDELHYVQVIMNASNSSAGTINDSSKIMYELGCQKAYALDGGQTAMMAINGEPVNQVDFGGERTVSDIIYFATALPEEGRA